MPLKYKFKKKDEIPAESVALYVEIEEKDKDNRSTGQKIWVLDVEGAVDKDRLDDFRQNNIRLSNELRDERQKWDGLDRANIDSLIESIGSLSADEVAKLLKDGKNIENLVQARTKAMQEEHSRKLKAALDEKERIQSRLQVVEIDQVTLVEGAKHGLRASATLDIQNRARQVFKLHEGKVVAFEADGRTVRYGKDGMTPLSIGDWMAVQAVEAAHLFEQNAGGGAAGGGSGGGTSKIANPWKKETFNLTNQMRVTRENPEQAKRFKAEAGVKENQN